MNKLKSYIPEWFTPTVTLLYLLSMLIIFPFFNTEKMFHLFLDKRDYFLVTSIVYLCVMLPQILITLYDWGKDRFRIKRADLVFALVLLAAFVISTFFSRDLRLTFFQMTSRTVSGLCFLCMLVVFLMVRQYGRLDKLLLWGWSAGSSAIYLCGVLCACGINFFNIQDGLEPGQLATYLTPLSNTNYNTCYVCLMLPAVMAVYLLCREKFTQKICGVNLYMGFLFTLFIKTESASIAIIMGLLLLGYFALVSDKWSARYIQISWIYLGAKLTIRILLLLFGKRLHPFHGLGALLVDYRVLLVETLCYLVFYMIWKKDSKKVREKVMSMRKGIIFAVMAAAGLCIAVVIAVNVNYQAFPKGSLWHGLILKDSTFNGRGYIWIRTMSAVRDESLLRKLFGNGLNSFRMVMQTMGKLPIDNDFADPHNEILQMTMDMGLLGLIGYFGLLGATLTRGIRNWRRNTFHIITILTVVIYMVQALANEYSIYTLPYLFIFLALVNGRSMDGLQRYINSK